MLTQKFCSWLWNQMFQYAYIKALSLRCKQDFQMDLSFYERRPDRPFELLEVFDIKNVKINNKSQPRYENLRSKCRYIDFPLIYVKKFFSKFNPHHYIEKQWVLNQNLINLSDNKAYIEWYFQSDCYFKDFWNQISDDFKFKNKLSSKSLDIRKTIENSESVSIHIRRWDYVTSIRNRNIFWTCSLEYYKKAIKYIKEHNPNKELNFFFFSDDIPWVKENFKWDNYYFIDWNKWKNSWEDMQLMSLCKHNIIANSSFSRRWAYLNINHKKIVIAPERWLQNKKHYCPEIIPNNWIKF